MVIPGLGDEADGIGLGVEQRSEARIVGEADAGPLGHAEGSEGRVLGALLPEEGVVGRVGAGIAALDIVDAEVVEQARHQHLVLERKVDAVGLRAVAQRRVEQVEAFLTHTLCPVVGAFLVNDLAPMVHDPIQAGGQTAVS